MTNDSNRFDSLNFDLGLLGPNPNQSLRMQGRSKSKGFNTINSDSKLGPQWTAYGLHKVSLQLDET